MKTSFAAIVLLAFAFVGTKASAYPEFVRHGYFSCTSCHVSPSGGSTLTEYGRSFAAEKLVTWTRKDEELVGHGGLPKPPEALIVGGNFRQIQTVVESSRSRSGRWIPMQRDVDACLRVSVTWTCATAGLVPKGGKPEANAFGLRKAMVRVDGGENFILRVGRFYPRHGLMIANHTSPVRRGLGFDEGKESDQVELTFLSEFVEATLYRDVGRKVRLSGDTEDGNAGFDSGAGGTVAAPVNETSRVGLSYRSMIRDDHREHIGGIFAAIGWSPRTFTLFEVDQLAKVAGGSITRGAVSHLKLAHEPVQGVVPYLVQEADVPDLRDQQTRKDTQGLGLQWFPRPHLELDAFYGHLLSHQDYSYAAVAYLILHYYL